MAENRLIALRADTDVFTTFEGDNHVLTQLVAKELLTAYADDIKGMSPFEWVRFAANTVAIGWSNALRPRPSSRPSSTAVRTTRKRAACSTAAPRSRCSRTARNTC